MAETNHGTTEANKETEALLTIWGDSKIQEEFDGAVHNKLVFERIAVSGGGIQTEVKAMLSQSEKQTKYREIKDGTQVQPKSPLDSAVILEGNEPEHDDSCNDEEKGNGVGGKT